MDSSLVIFSLITHLANLTNQNPNLRPAPLNKRILFRIVTTIPQQSRNNPAESPHSLHPTSSPAVPHVPQIRTHGALRRRICPICPSILDTWRASTPYMPHMSLNTGHMAHFNALYAPHVPQHRTHGAPQRPIFPICLSLKKVDS